MDFGDVAWQASLTIDQFAKQLSLWLCLEHLACRPQPCPKCQTDGFGRPIVLPPPLCDDGQVCLVCRGTTRICCFKGTQ